MNIVFLFVQLLIYHFFILLIRAQPSNYPLIFNPYASVAYLKIELPPSFIYPVLAACPAKSNEEKEMNENQSIDHKALFVREFYDNDVKLDDMIRCESNFELAVAVDSFKEPKHIKFGYEVYFEKSVIPEKAERVNTSHFGSYESENQENIFKGIQLPEESTCQSAENGCLEKYNLLMPYHFQSFPSSTVSCSDLTAIPIWHEVNKKLLDYSEKFIIAISEVTRQKLNVTSIVHQLLFLPYKNPNTGIIERKKIYLDWANKGFPVPRMIYKVVKYQSSYCKEKVDSCWFDMVVVIHNEPKFTQTLCEDKCEEWGWDSIQYLSTTEKNIETKSPFIYCCKLKEVSSVLEASFDYQIDYDVEDLNLKRFPYSYDENSKEIKYKDMHREFEAKMNELFEP